MSTKLQHQSSRRFIVAALLLTPGGVFVIANLLQHGLGLDGTADWLDPLFAGAGIAGLLNTLVLAGPVSALVLAATRLLPMRLVRDGDAWEVRIRVRGDVWAIAVAGASLIVGGILAGYLVAENLACVTGARTSC